MRYAWFLLLSLGCADPAEDARPPIDAEVLVDMPRVIIDAFSSRDDAASDAGPVDPGLDRDGDGVPDADDAFPDDPDESADRDGDGVGDNADAFPADPAETTDSDGDGVGDNADAFPEDPNEWADPDGDGVGNNSDPFPNDPAEWADNDNDGEGDNEDLDDDNDGLPDAEEVVPGVDCLTSNPNNPDSDGDGILDGDDSYPRDPFPEFLLRRNDIGSIELFLSNRDGTFADVVLIGEPIAHEDQPLTYQGFAIGDFDGNGGMDFLAQSSPIVEGMPTRQIWYFVRDTKADEFTQVFVGLSDEPLGTVITDADGDRTFDLVRMELERAGNIASGRLWIYLNNYPPAQTCYAGPTPEDGCFFVRRPAIDLTPTVGGQWVARIAHQAVDLNPADDAHPDLTMVTYASGGNSPTRVFTLAGQGDGTYAAPVERFVHNADRRQAPANTVLFADFNNDGVGDVMVGFDDDGAAGDAWTYFGVGDGTFFDQPVPAVDINPGNAREQGGGENLGRESSGRTFDFDFDGNADLIVGVHHVAYGAPGQTRLYRGNGNGSFAAEFSVVGAETRFSGSFAIPRRLCPEFQFQRDE